MDEAWKRIDGFQGLVDWFGHVPSFHDGYLLSLRIDFPTEAVLVLHGWDMTDRIDARGYFELEKHFVATFRLTGVVKVDLEDADHAGSIVERLTVVGDGDQLVFAINPILGTGGLLRCLKASVSFEPGKPTT
ncbi:hypothetical protein [Caulobacter hibisci]|uniref:Uncharacterized protein n=1 Tax=Caulobacter hibisci TaxID=2035993 RepID=A0ABS0SZJ7_9CAUL|nr:hypothetical protein [Caulobacter hibisci]MBI1685062.1 hypothetical protein [Caulobacter hibisci]